MADKDAEHGMRFATANGVIYGIRPDGEVVSDEPATTWPSEIERNTPADDLADRL